MFVICLYCHRHIHIHRNIHRFSAYRWMTPKTQNRNINSKWDVIAEKNIPIELMFLFSFSVLILLDFLTHILAFIVLCDCKFYLTEFKKFKFLSIQHDRLVELIGQFWLTFVYSWKKTNTYANCQSKVACILLIKNSWNIHPFENET